jgi:glycosyltransferase involved in cell wall biosynthesis
MKAGTSSLEPRLAASRLLVVISDRLSDLIRKGEITTRYYNPGDVFDEVHLLLTNDDCPDPEAIRKTVGRAVMHLHNVAAGGRLFLTTLGWNRRLLERWAQRGSRLAGAIRPDLIRCYGNYLNGFLGARIARDLHLPLVVSLHTDPDEMRARSSMGANWVEWLTFRRLLPLEITTLQAADWVLPAYESLRDYAGRRGARRVEVCYNVLNPEFLRRKHSYVIHGRPRIVSVGRQIPGKNPANVIRAVASLPGVELTLIGDGPLQPTLRRLAAESGAADRIVFRPAVSNDDVCRLLPDFDVFAAHCDFSGIPKAVLEPLLTGLPVVTNRRPGRAVPELDGNWVRLVDDTPESYRSALEALLADNAEREALGERAYAHAAEHWTPAIAEQRLADVHRRAMAAA